MKALVDSAAGHSVLPRPTLTKLGIKPYSERRFILANGRVGDALFEYRGQQGASPERGDSALPGVVTLGTLGLTLDSFRRELRPMPMVLM